MPYFPLFLDLTAAPVLVVGGGAVALRKASVLLDFGAEVHAVAPSFAEGFDTLSVSRSVRGYHPSDLEGKRLVVAATDDPVLQREIAEDCKKRGIPVNVADQPDAGTFSFPAVLRDGDVVVGISTGGKSPMLAKLLREELADALPDSVGALNEEMARRREELQSEFPGTDALSRQSRADALRGIYEEHRRS